MKRILTVLLAALPLLFASCGAEWDVMRKEGVIMQKYIDRNIKVYNSYTGEVELVYDGNGYIEMRNEGECVNLTILDRDTGQKIDVLGSGIHIISVTKEEE